MIQRLLDKLPKISGENAEAVRAYVREQVRVIRPEEVEPFRRWSDIITYYRGTKSEPTLVRDWLLPATRYAHRLTTVWVSRSEAISAPADAAECQELQLEAYRLGEQWLEAMVDSLEHTLAGDPSATRRHDAVSALARKHLQARDHASKKWSRLVKGLPSSP